MIGRFEKTVIDSPDPADPQQLHLDIRVTDPDAAEEQLLALGAERVMAVRETGFRVFLDPVGHPFCIVFGRPPGTAADAPS